ncbi:MAG: hypothetical protein V1800_04090 [Candidatus Latescibacterota bacterium]
MQECTGSAKLVAFVLIILGTLGLLANEFIAGWGRAATLASAALNVIGLLGLAYPMLRERKRAGK